MVEQLAAFRELRVVGHDQHLGYDRVYIECIFEKGSIVFRMAFNSDKQMTGAGVVPLETVPGGPDSPNPPSP